MKNFTIALFAIMMIAGFAMAQDSITVSVEVLTYDFVEITTASLTFTGVTPGNSVEMPFSVHGMTNDGMFVDYDFVMLDAPAGAAMNDITGSFGSATQEWLELTDTTVGNTLTVSAAYSVEPGTYADGTLTATIQ